MKKTILGLLALVLIFGAGVLFAEVAGGEIPLPPEPEIPSILDWIMENLWGFILGGLGAFGISIAIFWKVSRQVGEFLLAVAEFGEGGGDWATVKKEFLDIIQLFRNSNPLDTEKGIKKATHIVSGKTKHR